MRKISRRNFLRFSGMLALGLASQTISPLKAEALKFNRKMYKVSRMRLSMGTFVSMTLIHPSKMQADDAIGKAFDEINRLTRLMNRFDGGTAIGLLNQEGRLKDVPPEILYVIKTAKKNFEITNGAFDITVQPIVELFRQKLLVEKIKPKREEIEHVLERVGFSKMEIREREIVFTKEGMGITLDGIAKGYIIDRAAQVLLQNGIENFLINAGGDIRTNGSAKGGRPWTIAVEDPKKRGRYPDVIKMRNGAIATSGNYEVYYDKEKMFHHIIDPKTGYSPKFYSSVSVIAPDAIQADALATGIFVMEPEEAIDLVNHLPRIDSLLITSSGRKIRSAHWKRKV